MVAGGAALPLPSLALAPGEEQLPEESCRPGLDTLLTPLILRP